MFAEQILKKAKSTRFICSVLHFQAVLLRTWRQVRLQIFNNGWSCAQQKKNAGDGPTLSHQHFFGLKYFPEKKTEQHPHWEHQTAIGKRNHYGMYLFVLEVEVCMDERKRART